VDVRRFVIGAALSAALMGSLPVTAGADGRIEGRFGSLRDWGSRGGAGSTMSPEQTSRTAAARDHGQVFDRLDLRSRFDRPYPRDHFDPLDLYRGFVWLNVQGRFDRPKLRDHFDPPNVDRRFDRPDLRSRFDQPNLDGRFDPLDLRSRFDRSYPRDHFDPLDLYRGFVWLNVQGRFDRPNPRGRFVPLDLHDGYDPLNLRGRFVPPNPRGRFDWLNVEARFDRPNLRDHFDPPNLDRRSDRPDLHGRFDLLNGRDRFDPPNERDRFDPLILRSRFDIGPSSRLRQERNYLRLVAQLRKLIRVVVQKSVCHPRGKPPHGPFGYTSVGYFPGFGFDDDREEHDGRGHDGHEPPFCPSPH
jgi:hypothetical protein